MVYGILKLLNFAHGDVYMIGAFIGYGVLSGLGGPLSPDLALALVLLMFLAAMLGSGLLGVAIERFAYRPLREAPRLAPLISAWASPSSCRTRCCSSSARSSGRPTHSCSARRTRSCSSRGR